MEMKAIAMFTYVVLAAYIAQFHEIQSHKCIETLKNAFDEEPF